MIGILHDLFVGLCYLLGIGCVGMFVMLMFLVFKGCADQLRKGRK